MASHLFIAAAAVTLLGASFATVEGTRSAQSIPAGQPGEAPAGNMCRVDVVRSGQPGTAGVTRAVETDGSCVCTVVTGEAARNGAAETIVATLLRDRSCNGAPPPGGEAAFAPAGVGVWPFIVAPAGAAGLAAAAGNDSAG